MSASQEVLDWARRELPHHANVIACTPEGCCPVETCIRVPHKDETWHSNGITNWRGPHPFAKPPLRAIPEGQEQQ